MKPIEISDDLFCGRTDFCDAAVSNGCEKLFCGECHRKWPTPEQYREEYGEEYPDDGAVYLQEKDSDKWNIYFWGAVYASCSDCKVGCACTPFGKPDKDWRPEA